MHNKKRLAISICEYCYDIDQGQTDQIFLERIHNTTTSMRPKQREMSNGRFVGDSSGSSGGGGGGCRFSPISLLSSGKA